MFYLSNPTQEALFKTLLQENTQVDFTGDVDYFLGTEFTWIKNKDGNISIHLCQSSFTEFKARWFSVHTANKVPNMTPYCSGFPIDSIPTVDPLDPDLPRQRKFYQRIVGCINCMPTCTLPGIDPTLTFIASHSNDPHPQQYKATVHALKYLTSRNEYNISFHLQSSFTIQEFSNFNHHNDKGAYTEAIDPYLSEFHQLMAFCDANWGGQFGSTVEDCTPLELFKFRSLSGFLI